MKKISNIEYKISNDEGNFDVGYSKFNVRYLMTFIYFCNAFLFWPFIYRKIVTPT
jgi:hypothetical protein